MTEEKIKLILGVTDLEEANDAFELALFEIKSWLKSKPLLFLTAKSKLKRLEELKSIEHFFVEEKSEKIFESIPQEKLDQFSMTEWWNALQSFQTNWYKNVFDSETASELIDLISFYFHQKNSFCQVIKQDFSIDEEVVFGVESDWMVLEKGFQKIEKLELKSFEELLEQKSQFESRFFLELKRLSLLPKYLKAQI